MIWLRTTIVMFGIFIRNFEMKMIPLGPTTMKITVIPSSSGSPCKNQRPLLQQSPELVLPSLMFFLIKYVSLHFYLIFNSNKMIFEHAFKIGDLVDSGDHAWTCLKIIIFLVFVEIRENVGYFSLYGGCFWWILCLLVWLNFDLCLEQAFKYLSISTSSQTPSPFDL